MKKTTRLVSVAILFTLVFGIFAFTENAQARTASQQSEFVAPIMVVNASFLNVRTGPGIQYSILLTVVGGTELPVLGVARDRVWYQVSTIAGVGWVNSQYTLPRGDFRNVPFVEAPEVTQPGVMTPNMSQTEAGDDSIGAAPFGNGRQWGISVVVAHPFRSQATMNSSSLGSIPATPDFIYNVLAANTGDGIVWYQIDDPFLGIGWVEGPKSQFRPFACDLTAVVANQQVRPALGPDGSGTLDGNIPIEAGSEAYLLDLVNSFYKIELIDGNTGWVFSEAMSVRSDTVRSQFCEAGGTDIGAPDNPGMEQPDAGMGGGAQSAVARVVINTGFLNLRSGPGAQFTVVTTLPGGTELPVIGRAPDGVWYLVSGTFGQAWLNVNFTLFRGDGSNLPIIRDVSSAQLAAPTATITNAITLYATPNTTLGVIGALSGPVDVDIVARTPDFNWIQLRTNIGFGWVLSNQVEVRGDTSLIPVVGG